MTNKALTRRYLAHLGVILMNFGIVGIIYSTGVIFSGFFYFLFYLLMLMLGILTLGLVLLAPEYRAFFTGTNQMSDTITNLYNSLQYVLPIVFIFMIVSLIFMLMDRKWEKSKPRIIVGIIFLSILVIVTIAFIVGLVAATKGGEQ